MAMWLSRGALMAPAAAVVLCVLPALAAAQEVKIVEKAPAVGTVVSVQKTTSMQMKLDIKFGDQAQKKSAQEDSKEVFEYTIQEVNAKAPTKVRVTYKSIDKTKREDQNPPEKETFGVVGKTYTVSFTDGALKIVDAQGQEPPVQDLEHIRKDFKSLGEADSFLKILPQRALKVGEKFDLTKELAQELFGGEEKSTEGMDLSQSTVTLKAIKKVNGVDAAVFDLAMNIKGEQGPLRLTMNLKGEVVVTVQGGHLIQAALQGPLEMNGGDGGPAVFKGSGKMSFGTTQSYKKP